MDAHNHSHGEKSGNLKIAFLLNVGFTILEFFGGLWTNSIAILSDSLHDSGDCLSLGLAWYLQKLSHKGPDEKFTYGYRRFSTLGALFTGVVLAVGLAFVAWKAIQRLQNPQEVNAPGMVALAVTGVIFNGFAAWKLRGGHSLNEKVASWHLLEDVLGWVAVLIGSVIMTFWNVPIIDPILSLLISAFVLWNVFKNLKKVALVFMQAAPSGFTIDDFDCEITKSPGVIAVHHTHTWTMDGEHHVFSTHLMMKRGVSREEIVAAKRRVDELLEGRPFEHITVEVELEGETDPTRPQHRPDNRSRKSEDSHRGE